MRLTSSDVAGSNAAPVLDAGFAPPSAPRVTPPSTAGRSRRRGLAPLTTGLAFTPHPALTPQMARRPPPPSHSAQPSLPLRREGPGDQRALTRWPPARPMRVAGVPALRGWDPTAHEIGDEIGDETTPSLQGDLATGASAAVPRGPSPSPEPSSRARCRSTGSSSPGLTLRRRRTRRRCDGCVATRDARAHAPLHGGAPLRTRPQSAPTPSPTPHPRPGTLTLTRVHDALCGWRQPGDPWPGPGLDEGERLCLHPPSDPPPLLRPNPSC